MPNLTITLDANAVELITNALFAEEHHSTDELAASCNDLRQAIVSAWVLQNPEDADLPWRR